MLEMVNKSLLGKVKERPDLFKWVILKIKTEGIFDKYKVIIARLNKTVNWDIRQQKLLFK